MHSRHFPSRFFAITTAALAAARPVALAAQPANGFQTFDYHHGNVLGTALDLKVIAANRDDADAADKAVMAEINRLQKILSAYDADTELAKLNASPVNSPGVPASPELIDVLKKYEVWAEQTRGAYTGHVGDLIAIWKKAETDGRLPSDAELQTAADHSKAPAWEIDDAAKTVRRVSDQQINVDSVGKGYIIDKAVQAATVAPKSLKGLLLSIGGDLRTWGEPSADKGALWTVGVQDPDHPELNAKPLTTVFVAGKQSVSTSGAYQRFYTIDGKRYSHILDARTGKPGKNQAATVVAPDSATANALATICCTLKFAEAFALVRSVPGAECLLVMADGTQLRSDGFKDLQDKSKAAERFAPRLASQFPAGFKLTIDLNVTPSQNRPYVFAWVTDSAGNHVKTLAAFGNEDKWLKEMRAWWKIAAGNKLLLSITHATQAAGKYPLAWDGTNQKGSGVPLGKYNVWVEVGSEHGPYAAKFATIEIGEKASTATIGESSAFPAVKVTYGPGAK